MNTEHAMNGASGHYDIADVHSFVIDPASGDIRLYAVGPITVHIKRDDWNGFVQTVTEEHATAGRLRNNGHTTDTTTGNTDTTTGNTDNAAGNTDNAAGNTDNATDTAAGNTAGTNP